MNRRSFSMDSAIRRTLWGAFTALCALIVIGLVLALYVLQASKQQEFRIVHGSESLLDAVQQMDEDVLATMAAARGFLLTQQTQFLQQYDDADRDFDKQAVTAVQLASDPRDAQLVSELRRHYREVRQLTDQQIVLARDGKVGNANEYMLETARIHRSTPDYAGTLVDEHRRRQASDLEQLNSTRQLLSLLLIVLSVVVVVLAAYTIGRIQQSLAASINRQTKRMETIIGGMSDGVMLVDREGKSVFINTAGQRLLGR